MGTASVCFSVLDFAHEKEKERKKEEEKEKEEGERRRRRGKEDVSGATGVFRAAWEYPTPGGNHI